jgi:small multidrug resistance pump
MSAGLILWLAGTMVVFLAANSVLRSYVDSNSFWVIIVALLLYSLGNLLMVRLMRESGMGVAISVSSILQLLLATAVGIGWFGERPTVLQLSGIALGVVAVALILMPRPGNL